MKISELQEGGEYYGTFYGVKIPSKYKIENSKLIFYCVIGHIWRTSDKSYNDIINAEFEPCEWVPKKGEKAYYPDFSDALYEVEYWDDSDCAEAIKRNVGVYRTKEEAIARAKSLGWT